MVGQKWIDSIDDSMFLCDCQDSQRDLDNALKSRIAKKNAKLFQKVINSLRHSPCSFKNYKATTEQMRHALESAKGFVESFLKNRYSRGLFFFGTPGTGKTHLCVAIIREIFSRSQREINRNDIKFTTITDFLTEIKESYNTSCSEKSIMDKYTGCKLLVLDDLGKEYSKGESNTWADEKLYELIDTRYKKLLPMIITTNLGLTQLERKIDSAVVSRIFEMCDGINCVWTDHRKA